MLAPNPNPQIGPEDSPAIHAVANNAGLLMIGLLIRRYAAHTVIPAPVRTPTKVLTPPKIGG